MEGTSAEDSSTVGKAALGSNKVMTAVLKASGLLNS